MNKFKNFRIKKKKHKNTRCGAIIFNSDLTKLLIVENNYLYKESRISKWGLPKGVINYSETFNECAMREIWEETGLKINIGKNQLFLKINESYYFPIKMNENKALLNIHDIDEIKSVGWFDISYIQNCLNCNKDLHELLQTYLYRAKSISNKVIS